MAVEDRRGDVEQLVAVLLRVVAQHLEGVTGVDRVTGGQDLFRLLDRRPTPGTRPA
jgi:hypothetical protein